MHTTGVFSCVMLTGFWSHRFLFLCIPKQRPKYTAADMQMHSNNMSILTKYEPCGHGIDGTCCILLVLELLVTLARHLFHSPSLIATRRLHSFSRCSTICHSVRLVGHLLHLKSSFSCLPTQRNAHTVARNDERELLSFGMAFFSLFVYVSVSVCVCVFVCVWRPSQLQSAIDISCIVSSIIDIITHTCKKPHINAQKKSIQATQ